MMIKIATADSRRTNQFKNEAMSLEAFYDRLSKTVEGKETMEEYLALTKAERDELKDVGGFVGGWLKEGKRRKGHVLFRSVLTLDVDYGVPGIIDEISVLHGFSCCFYSTRKHTEEKPRLRLIVPLAREITEEEYEPVARMIASDIGMDYFDDSTYQAERMMYFPSTCKEAPFVFEIVEGEVINPDDYLARYKNWTDASEYPVSSRVKELIKKNGNERMEDPLMKQGAIGVFCRAYDIHEAIETFLPNIYAPTTETNRYHYIDADSSAGLVVYEDKFAYSHHSSDPVQGRLLNAFDLVRLHLFGEQDEKYDGEDIEVSKLPSFKSILRLIANDEKVAEQVVVEQAGDNFAPEYEGEESDWKCLLLRDLKTNKIENKLENYVTILRFDRKLQGICYDLLKNCMVVNGEVPWKKHIKGWADSDISNLRVYIEKEYGIYHASLLRDALASVTQERAYHPVREYLDSLEWDGEKRIERLLIDYLGAEDNLYVRAVTKKTLVAAVARAFQPGVKFDHILVLNGPQSIGKSTLIERIGKDWYSNSLSVTDMKDKTGAEKLQGVWIMELCELAGIKKMEVETLKSFTTSTDDLYRPAYGEVASSHPRQCIIIGTTNAQDDGFLRDTTGNRRFWPVRLSKNKVKNSWDLSRVEVDQLWAEAKSYFDAGELLYLVGEEAEIAIEEQREAMEFDDRQGIIEAYLEKPISADWYSKDTADRVEVLQNGVIGEVVQRKFVCCMELWVEALNNPKNTYNKAVARELNQIMTRVPGWKRGKHNHDFGGTYNNQKYYERIS